MNARTGKPAGRNSSEIPASDCMMYPMTCIKLKDIVCWWDKAALSRHRITRHLNTLMDVLLPRMQGYVYKNPTS